VPRWQRAYLAACVWVVVYTLMYVGVTYGKIPHLVYYQIERRFELQVVGEGVLPSGYVGVWLWALLAGLAAGGVAYLVLGLRKHEASGRTLSLWLAWSMTSFAIAVGFYTWNNWP
jgi:hypothetical protein